MIIVVGKDKVAGEYAIVNEGHYCNLEGDLVLQKQPYAIWTDVSSVNS